MRHATVSGLLAAVSLAALSPAFAQEAMAEDVTAEPVLETEMTTEQVAGTETVLQDGAVSSGNTETTEDTAPAARHLAGLAVIDATGRAVGSVAEVVVTFSP